VYVKVLTDSPCLVCMDWARSQEELIDPKYLWTGPDGKNLKGHKDVNLTDTGQLVVIGVKESLSGTYTCTLSHNILETTPPEERETVEVYKFVLYAYRAADHTYLLSVRFPTRDHFLEELKKLLNSIIADLTCHIAEASCRCHSVQTPQRGLRRELFLRFQVNPFAPGWEEVCHQVPYDCEAVRNKRAQEAKARLGKFFREQAYALKHQLQTAPTIHYVDNSFAAARTDSCPPGFGKNNVIHQSCASCCVVCEPGTYSPDTGVTCQVCKRPRVRKYGARSC
ncbi:Zona pellucida-binding protein 2, partial [Buceros rhinoceros silvestris]